MVNRDLNKIYRKTLIGKIFLTNQFGNVKIIQYENRNLMMVEFLQTGTICSARLDNLRAGKLLDPFAERKNKLVFGKGYLGINKSGRPFDKNVYKLWYNMLNRCYNPKMHAQIPAYRPCSVCKEWLNYQNFSAWVYSQIKESKYALDKDILIKGNKEYAPDRCAMVPQEINNLFEKREASRGNCPIGVYYNGACKQNPFIAQCNNGAGKNRVLGYFPSAEEAFNHYKMYKETLIKQKAEKYRGRIDSRVYEAMMNYEVEITD